MFRIVSFALLATSLASSASGYTIAWTNRCAYDVWPGVGRAPYGQVDPSVSFGAYLPANGGTASYGVDDHQTGIRNWARTGCDSKGANCQTGKSNGGLYPADAGITSAAIYFESGYQSQGNVINWNLSRVDSQVNVPVTVTSSADGNTKTCQNDSCPTDQAFAGPDDNQADTTSPIGTTFQVTYC